MRYLSLFSGVGGFELGIQRAFDNQHEGGGDKVLSEKLPDTPGESIQGTATCIGYSEIDQHAIKTYEEHYDHKNYGDVTTINAGHLPDFDLLVGGFPCQAFSVAGKRAGFNDTRGTLFFDIVRVLKDKRPRHLVLENVKGLLSHDSGKTFQTILRVLANLGYGVEWQVLNTKDFGVPQNRERIFIIGHLRADCSRQVLPIRGSNGKATKIIGRVELNGHDYLKRVYSKEGASPTIPTKTGGGHIPKTAVRQPLRYLKRNQKNIAGDYAFTVDASQTSGIKQGLRIRRLTPVECERLMSWPDNWTIGSDTQRYKQCGNGVVSNVVQAVMGALAPCM